MAVPGDHFETIAKYRSHEIRMNDLEWRALADDPAIRDRDDPRGERRREVQIVEHRTHRELATRPQIAKELERRELVARIEMDSRLVQKENGGLLRERHRENRALTFAAREAIDRAQRLGDGYRSPHYRQ